MSINIYQILTRLFNNPNNTNKPFGTLDENGCSKFNLITSKALTSLKELGITHVWYTGVIRHASCNGFPEHGIVADNPLIVKGVAGSPYAIKDYFDVSPDLAEDVPNRMQEFERLVARTHEAELKVIIDFVPNHVCRQYNALNRPEGVPNLGENDNPNLAFSPDNNFYYIPNEQLVVPIGINFPYTLKAERYHEKPAKGTGNSPLTSKPLITDWYETVKLNYGVDIRYEATPHLRLEKNNTWKRMREILEYWASKGVDGFRCDMVEMVPLEFWEWVIPRVRKKYENIIFIAEIYNPNEYRRFLFKGEFDYLYDKVGLYDTLRHIIEGKAQAWKITDCWKAQEGYSQRMLRFMENHDEQRIASKQFAGNPRAAIPAMIVAATMHSGPLMIYFGQEIGEPGSDHEGFSTSDGRTTIFDYWCLKNFQKWVNNGAFDGGELSAEQKEIRNFYQNLLSLRLSNAAIHDGNFYDLMWANQSDNLFSQKNFVYLRYTPKQVLLIVLNFDGHHSRTMQIRIPEHALELTRLSEVPTVKGIDLLGYHPPITFDPINAHSNGVAIYLPKCSGAIFELKGES